MLLSLEGAAVCFALFLMGALVRAPLLVPMMASLAFGSTAIATLSAVGGSSPLIYTVFSLLLIVSVCLYKGITRRLTDLLMHSVSSWAAFALVIYAVIGAYLLPRLFAGQVTVFLVSHDTGRVVETPLQPSSSNVTQAGYMVLGLLAFLVLRIRLQQRSNFLTMKHAFFSMTALNALLGSIDLAAKLAGAGDVLLPIRTASYALLTDSEQAGFARIVGGFPEASAFGAAGLASLAFAFTYWRATGSRPALALWLVLVGLLLLSTSSTAYVGLGLMIFFMSVSRLVNISKTGISRQDLVLCTFVGLITVSATVFVMQNPRRLDPIVRLSNETLFEKSNSDSAQERSYWNMHSLESIIETEGLGLGIGSSRASNWPTAVLSQLGVVGSIPMLILLVSGLRQLDAVGHASRDREIVALFGAARATAFAVIAGGLFTAGSADPGMLFFVCIATAIACRHYLNRVARGARNLGANVLEPLRVSRSPFGLTQTAKARTLSRA